MFRPNNTLLMGIVFALALAVAMVLGGVVHTGISTVSSHLQQPMTACGGEAWPCPLSPIP
jgi:hypothetical protein